MFRAADPVGPFAFEDHEHLVIAEVVVKREGPLPRVHRDEHRAQARHAQPFGQWRNHCPELVRGTVRLHRKSLRVGCCDHGIERHGLRSS
jgi:hypothetical protein